MTFFEESSTQEPKNRIKGALPGETEEETTARIMRELAGADTERRIRNNEKKKSSRVSEGTFFTKPFIVKGRMAGQPRQGEAGVEMGNRRPQRPDNITQGEESL